MTAEPAGLLPVVLSLALAAIFVVAVAGIMIRRRGRRPVADTPTNEAYRIYTREYDLVLTAADLPAALYEGSPDRDKGYLDVDDREWRAQIENAENIYRRLSDPSPLMGSEAVEFQGAAVLLMIDQSGSMRGQPMAWVAAGARKLSEELRRRGASVGVAGYTTAGWHGGFARNKWLRAGRPKRPGRLCALLHVIYQAFDDTGPDDNAWRQMLNPDILRENVDGESLQWGADYLKGRCEQRRILLVVSDGAPVDDATLLENGASYLQRHFLAVRDALLHTNELELLAIGAGYHVSEFYPVSREATDAAGLVNAGLELIRIGESPK